MKTILALAQQPGFAAAVKTVLSPARYRVVAAADLGEVAPLLGQGLIDACLLELELTNIQPIRLLEALRRMLPACPLLVYASASQREWEEEALLLGVAQVLAKPIRGRLLNEILDRFWGAVSIASPIDTPTPSPSFSLHPPLPPTPLPALDTLRRFAQLLRHTLHSDELLKAFLGLLREVIGVNRAAIFLHRRTGPFGARGTGPADHRLTAACALGITPGLLEHFEFSLDTGIGRYIHRFGRILQRGSEEARLDRQIQQEFELLGVQVAVPILDREALLGVALFDAPLAGGTFGSDALTLIFRLLEELGLAIRDAWQHERLIAQHQSMADILDQLGSACVLVGPGLEVLQFNQAAKAMFTNLGQLSGPLEFSQLPQALGTLVYEALRAGAEPRSTLYRPPNRPGTVFRVQVSPFRRENSAATAALLVVEDFSEHERAQRLDLEAAKLRLTKTIAEHLAHEIGNSLTPLSAHQQMLADRYGDPEFQASLTEALADGVRRISRLSRQMLHLASEDSPRDESIPVASLVEEAFEHTQLHFHDRVPRLSVVGSASALAVRGCRVALKEALAEVLLNAFQAKPDNPQVEVHCHGGVPGASRNWVVLDVCDSGPGFTQESARRATEPFYSTKVVGLGLGLTVAQKVLESQNGKIEIVALPAGEAGCVRITLPAAEPIAEPARTGESQASPGATS